MNVVHSVWGSHGPDLFTIFSFVLHLFIQMLKIASYFPRVVQRTCALPSGSSVTTPAPPLGAVFTPYHTSPPRTRL